MLRDVFRFLWRRDSESACCLMIGLCEFLSSRDLVEMREYCEALEENRRLSA